MYVISIFCFYKLELFCLETLKSEQRNAYSYEIKSKGKVPTILKLISLLNCTCNCSDTDSHSDISSGIISPCFRSSSSSFENIKEKILAKASI